jgi:hypothetical protein
VLGPRSGRLSVAYVDVIQKDYVLGWLLAAIASEARLADIWVFKGRRSGSA